MVTEIMKGISAIFKGVFGDNYKTYFSKDVLENLEPPCFIIGLVNSSLARQIGLRYRQDNSFAIQYFPKDDRNNAEMIDIAGRLYEILEFIQLLDGDMLRGTEMHYSIQDGVLHFSVEYNVFLKCEPETDEMESIKIFENNTQGG